MATSEHSLCHVAILSPKIMESTQKHFKLFSLFFTLIVSKMRIKKKISEKIREFQQHVLQVALLACKLLGGEMLVLDQVVLGSNPVQIRLLCFL